MDSAHSEPGTFGNGTGFCLLFFVLVLAVPAWADEKEESAATVKSSDGLHFIVPPDWPIERRNGIVGPVPIEEYMAKKFGALNKRLDALEKKIGALESKVTALENEARKKALQSTPQPVSSVPATSSESAPGGAGAAERR
ncbi:MAG: hypothetical protein HYZ94_02615 [Candidatus Omnitrophica bacterium]|nr:hypothetical protein [Candidatus Omnitrophota bacterium]